MSALVPTLPEQALVEARNAVREDASQGGGDPILKLSQTDGSFSVGTDDEPVAHGTKFFAIPASFVHGWQCWKDGKPRDANVGSMFKPLPKQDMDQHGPFDPRDSQEGWSRVAGVTLVTMDGDQYAYKPSSQGGRNALSKLAMAFLDVANEDANVPVISISSDSYYSKKRGKTFHNPILSIEQWVPADVVAEAMQPAAKEKGTPSLSY